MLECTRWSRGRDHTIVELILRAKHLLDPQPDSLSTSCVALLLGRDSQRERLENRAFENARELSDCKMSNSDMPNRASDDDRDTADLSDVTSRVQKSGCLLVAAYLA